MIISGFGVSWFYCGLLTAKGRRGSYVRVTCQVPALSSPVSRIIGLVAHDVFVVVAVVAFFEEVSKPSPS
jgi:hypothetical protein